MQYITRLLLPLLLLVALAAQARGGLLPCLDPYYPWSIRVGPYLNVTDPSGCPAWFAGHGWYDQYDYWMEKSNTVQEVHIGDTLTINLHDTNVSIINGDHGTAYWNVEEALAMIVGAMVALYCQQTKVLTLFTKSTMPSGYPQTSRSIRCGDTTADIATTTVARRTRSETSHHPTTITLSP